MESNTFNTTRTWTVSEFAKHYGISRPTAYALTEKPGFPVIRVGRRKLIQPEKLDAWFTAAGAGGRSVL